MNFQLVFKCKYYMKNLCGLTCAWVASHSSALESATRDHRNFSSHHTESEERCSWVCFTLIKLTLSLLHCEHPKVTPPTHTNSVWLWGARSASLGRCRCPSSCWDASSLIHIVWCHQDRCLGVQTSPAQTPEDSSHTQRLLETVHMECEFSHFK